jgi:hypothetical protein
VIQVTGELSREHWIVPVRGLTGADPDGIVQVIAGPDGTVILNLACGDTRTGVRIEVIAGLAGNGPRHPAPRRARTA